MKYKIGQVWSSSNDVRQSKYLVLAVYPNAHVTDIHYVICQDVYRPTMLNKIFAFEAYKDEFAKLGTPKLDVLVFDPYKEFLKKEF